MPFCDVEMLISDSITLFTTLSNAFAWKFAVFKCFLIVCIAPEQENHDTPMPFCDTVMHTSDTIAFFATLSNAFA